MRISPAPPLRGVSYIARASRDPSGHKRHNGQFDRDIVHMVSRPAAFRRMGQILCAPLRDGAE